MKKLHVIAMMLISAATSLGADVVESTATGNVQALSGKWTPVKSSHHLLDSKLVSSGKTGIELAIDKKLGESHRKTSDTYYEQYSAFLKNNGHTAVASGYIKFDYGGEGELVISTKSGSLYLWYGIVTGGNPRIFIGRGSDEASASTMAVEWASWCSDSPVDLNSDFATVIYERVENKTAPGRVAETANHRLHGSGGGKRVLKSTSTPAAP